MSDDTQIIRGPSFPRKPHWRIMRLTLPHSMRAVTTHRDEIDMFEGMESWDKDPTKSIHIDEVALPEVGPNEALVAVMVSCINFNTVWSAIFEPIPTFQFLERAETQPLGSAP